MSVVLDSLNCPLCLPKSIALSPAGNASGDRAAESRTIGDERVKLTMLTARVDDASKTRDEVRNVSLPDPVFAGCTANGGMSPHRQKLLCKFRGV